METETVKCHFCGEYTVIEKKRERLEKISGTGEIVATCENCSGRIKAAGTPGKWITPYPGLPLPLDEIFILARWDAPLGTWRYSMWSASDQTPFPFGETDAFMVLETLETPQGVKH